MNRNIIRGQVMDRSSKKRHMKQVRARDTIWSFAVLCLASLCGLLICSSQPEVAALKLPSLFSWIQHQPQMTSGSSAQIQQQASNSPAQTTSAALLSGHQYFRHNNGGRLHHHSGGRFQQSAVAADEPMVASGSVFDANRAVLADTSGQAQQQQAAAASPATSSTGSSLRKPFQSILMLPSKHSQIHLFSGLPKSLFGRLLSSGSSNSPAISSLSGWRTQQSQQPPIPPANQQPSIFQMPNGGLPFQQPQFQLHNSKLPLGQLPVQFQLNAVQQQQFQHQMRGSRPHGARSIGPNPESFPKKHALGFGDSGEEFVLIGADGHPLSHQLLLANQSPPEAMVSPPEQLGNFNSLDRKPQQQPPHPTRGQQQHPASHLKPPMGEDFQEAPVVSIAIDEQPSSNNPQAPEVAPPQATSNSTGNHQPPTGEEQVDGNQDPGTGNRTQAAIELMASESSASNSSSGSGQSDGWRSTSGLSETTSPTAGQQQVSSSTEAGGEMSTTTTTESPVSSTMPQELSSTTTDKSLNQTSGQQAAGERQQPEQAAGGGSGESRAEDQELDKEQAAELDSREREPEQEERMQPAAIFFVDPQAMSTGQASAMDEAQLGSQLMALAANESQRLLREPEVAAHGSGQRRPVAPAGGGMSLETSSSESAVIVSPSPTGDGSGAGGSQVSDPLSGESDHQMESFILGPYKGLTSDNLTPIDHTTNNNRAQLTSTRFQQPTGISSKASSLLQQAKSLIQMPFVHMNQQQQLAATFQRDPMAKEQSAQQLIRSAGGFVTFDGQTGGAQFVATGSRQPQVQGAPWQVASASLGQKQAPANGFGGKWPSHLQPFVMQGATSLRPVHASRQQPPVAQQSDGYFLMQPPTGAAQGQRLTQHNKPQQTSAGLYLNQRPQASFIRPHHLQPQMGSQSFGSRAPLQQQANGAPLIQSPYFVADGSMAQFAHREPNGNNNFARFAAQQPALISGPIAQQNQQSYQPTRAQPTGYHVVVDHSGSGQQQEQLALSQQQAKKFKSGLYQIDPPKLSDSANEAQVQQQQVNADSDEDEQSSQAQQSQRDTQHDTGDGSDESDSEETSGGDEQVAQQATESPSVNGVDEQQQEQQQPSARGPISKQVGASMGVAPTANSNRSLRGQVYNEPLGATGQRLSENQSLSFTQDVTLYDLEMPSRKPEESQSPRQFADRPNPGVSFLDTQVYTVPYSLNAQVQPQQPQYQRQQQQGSRQPLVAPPARAPTANRYQQQFHSTFQYHPALMQRRPMAQQSQVQQSISYQQPQAQQLQVGRFPLPYMAPPEPARNQVPQITNLNAQYQRQPSAGYRLSYNHNLDQQQQAAPFKSVYQHSSEFSGPQATANQVNWVHPLNQLANVPALSIQTLDEEASAGQRANEALTRALANSANGQQQHYFHYQPVAQSPLAQPQQQLFHQPLQPQQQRAQLVAGAGSVQYPALQSGVRQQQVASSAPRAQTIYELAPERGQQHQFVLAIQHQPGDSANAASFASSSDAPADNQLRPGILSNPQASEANHEEPFESSSLFGAPVAKTEEGSPSSAAQPAPQESQNPAQGPRVATAINTEEDNTVTEVEQPEAVTETQSSAPKQEQSPQQGDRIREQAQVKLTDSRVQSQVTQQAALSPSAFCSDRAPGLYADESQRCKAYYQCAPTGHQMFRCNNQTQFNQKTQNCDWWYNVNCGGRLGSQSDFEPTPAAQPADNPVSNSGLNLSHLQPIKLQQQQHSQSQQRQPDREAAASNQDSTGSPLNQVEPQTVDAEQQVASLGQQSHQQMRPEQNPRVTIEEQPVRQQQQPGRVKTTSGHWSTIERQPLPSLTRGSSARVESSLFQRQQPEAATQSSGSGSISSTLATPSFGQQLNQFADQQAAPTSATPIYTNSPQSSSSSSLNLANLQQETTEGFGGSQTTTTQEPQSQYSPTTMNGASSAFSEGTSTDSSSSSSTASNPLPASAQTLPEPKPQVGANLNDELQQPSITTTGASDEQTAAATSTSISTISDSPTSTQSTTTTLASASSSTNSPVAGAADSTTISEQAQQQPDNRVGQQQQQPQSSNYLNSGENSDVDDNNEDRSDRQQSQEPEARDQQPGNRAQAGDNSKRLVQSEFGVGVQQPYGQLAAVGASSKLARSAARFEFTRFNSPFFHGVRAEPLGGETSNHFLSGNIFAENDGADGQTIQPQQLQYAANHKYSFGEQAAANAALAAGTTTSAYPTTTTTTSANQPSASTIATTAITSSTANSEPFDVHFLTAKGVQEAEAAAAAAAATATAISTTAGSDQAAVTQSSSGISDIKSNNRRLERRFGARLLPTSSTQKMPDRSVMKTATSNTIQTSAINGGSSSTNDHMTTSTIKETHKSWSQPIRTGLYL